MGRGRTRVLDIGEPDSSRFCWELLLAVCNHLAYGRDMAIPEIEPVTELDERFSDPAASATPWRTTRDLFASADLAWISTVRPDGRPHVTPLVPVWSEGAAYFTTGADEQKAKNLSANPAVVITTGCNDWTQGIDVMVEGVAHRVTDRDALERLAEVWRMKWNGEWIFEVGSDGFVHEHGESIVYRVRPTKVLAFGKGVSSHTRHRFPVRAPGSPGQPRSSNGDA